jgi:hypothetical protein
MNLSSICRTFPLLAFAIGVLGIGTVMPSHAQAIQKWVDEKGKVHFGDVPPPDADATTLKLKVSPPSETPKPAQPPAKKTDTDAGKTSAAKGPSDEERRAAADASAKSRKMAECSKRLEALQREVRAQRAFARRGSSGGGEAAFDAYAAKEDAWLAQNCQ